MRRFPIPATNRRTLEYDLESSQTFLSGAIVLLDGTPEVTEAGADPTSVLGIAAHQAGDRDVLPTKQLVHVATEEATFWMEGDDDPVASDVNVSYGVAKDADNVWHVDGTDTTNLVVTVRAIDTDLNLYKVSFLEAVRQYAP